MLSRRIDALSAAFAVAAAAALAVAQPVGAARADCRITAPAQWGGSIPGYPTTLHHGLDTDWNNQVRPVGDVKAIMLFVDFPNATAENNPDPYNQTQAYYDNLVPQAVDFFDTASYGRFKLTVDAPQRFYRMSRDDADYHFAYITPPEVAAEYIDEAMTLAEEDVDFSQYSLIYVVPTRNAKAIPYSPEWNDYRGVVVHHGRVFKNGVTFGQDAWNWGYHVLNHETGHDMGLPEDYNATGSGPTFQYTGGWDVMGNIAGVAPDYFAWEKWKLGWLDDDQIACVTANSTTTQTLSPVETPGGTKAIVARTGTYSAYVAEVRANAGVDGTICYTGVLIYRLDAARWNGSGSIRVVNAHPNTNLCGDPLNAAPYDLDPGPSSFYDSATGTSIELLGTEDGSYTVRVTQGTPGKEADPAAECHLPNRAFLGEGDTNWDQHPMPVGPLKAAVIFRGYSDPDAEFARLKPAEDFYWTSSYGRYQLEMVQVPVPAVLPDEDAALVARRERELGVSDVVVPEPGVRRTSWGAAAQAVSSSFDFSDIDLVFLVDANVRRSYAEIEKLYIHGHDIKAGATIGTDWPQHRALVLSHEMGHTISLPDLYIGGPDYYAKVGGWDLMGNLGGVSPDPFAWEKWKLGWLDDEQITCVRTVNQSVEATLTPVEAPDGGKALVVRYAETRAYVAEVRTAQGNNAGTCATGVLITRIDSAVASGNGPDQVIDGHPGGGCGPGSFFHKLNTAPFDVGQTFTDDAAGVTFEIVSQSGDDYVVRATYGTPLGR